MPPSAPTVKHLIRTFDFRKLFLQNLGWDKHAGSPTVTAAGRDWQLTAVAEKRGVQAFACAVPTAADLPSATEGRAVAAALAATCPYSVVVFHDAGKTRQAWQFSHRTSADVHCRRMEFVAGQSGERLAQELARVAFDLSEEGDLTHVEAANRLRAVAQMERTTKRFFTQFQTEHAAFHEFIQGLEDAVADRAWYASLMLNRLMFVYFIQKKGFLDGNPNYLRDKLAEVQARRGKGQFLSFYKEFLKKLFHDGLGKKADARTADLARLLGTVPYLNGGLFDVHELERKHPHTDIPDEAFERLFTFFDRYQWHLDDRPLRRDDEINPDVLGYIFEKYINQKQMGAYYTKEDVTGYITRNTLLPFVLCKAAERCAVAFAPAGPVWRQLRDDPDRYLYPAVRRGVELVLPATVAAGLTDVAARGGWNRPADDEFALPTETWREHIARRQRCLELRAKLAAGEVTAVNDLVTHNLDLVRFVADLVEECEGSDLLLAVWQTLTEVSVLDPTCGSGAFLFAALNLLAPLYEACLDRMGVFLAEADKEGAKAKYREFREVLKEADWHPSRRYYILRSVVVNNLYGVDLMAEAVEICKLRLFLKLVAQVDRADQLEPLPDIDFNVRAGNTLVGFATPAATRAAVGLTNYAQLDAIEAAAVEVERKCRLYRQYHVQLRDDQLRLSFTKQELQADLTGLRDQLDRFLAAAYGVPADDPVAVAGWRASHQPFHWWAEYHGILARGGFDVIVGNPPYIQLSEVKSYRLREEDYATQPCGNLYAPVLERCAMLVRPGSRQGYIVPVSSISTAGYATLQQLLRQRPLWYSSFDDRPSRLFDGLEHIRLTIHLIGPTATAPTLVSSRYNKWAQSERDTLFEKLVLTPAAFAPVAGSFTKLCHPCEAAILAKLVRQRGRLGDAVVRGGEGLVYYSRKVGYFLQVLDFKPEVRNGRGELRDPSEFKEVRFATQQQAAAALCQLNSSLFYWFVTAVSDCRHLNKREVDGFPVNLPALAAGPAGPHLSTLADDLMASLRVTSEHRQMRSGNDTLTVQCIIPKHSKPLINQIDAALATHYGFTVEELDFIRNYDIKYRLGADADTAA